MYQQTGLYNWKEDFTYTKQDPDLLSYIPSLNPSYRNFLADIWSKGTVVILNKKLIVVLEF